MYFEGLEGRTLTLAHDPIIAHAFESTGHVFENWKKSWDEDAMIIHFRRRIDAMLFMYTFEGAFDPLMRLGEVPEPLYLGEQSYVD